jgi:antitoxin CptB
MDRVARDRLRWKCRRGLLELDLVLERFLAREAARLDGDALERLDELLELPDNDLWEIVAGRSDRYERRHRELVARLRGC